MSTLEKSPVNIALNTELSYEQTPVPDIKVATDEFVMPEIPPGFPPNSGQKLIMDGGHLSDRHKENEQGIGMPEHEFRG